MGKLNLEAILHALRDRIEYAVEHDERRLLGEIATTFGIIEEAAYGTDDREIFELMGELSYVASEGSMGFGFKQQLPSHEKISQFFEQYGDS